MKFISIIVISLIAANAWAACYRAPSGRLECGNGYNSGGYNPNTGNSWSNTTNPNNGVKTYENSNGAEAKYRNGVGVYQAPSGKTCVKGRFSAGCN